jgi:N-glycosidase YbiA
MIAFNGPKESEYDYVFSNFSPSTIVIDGIEYPTVEHAYQAQKAVSVEDKKAISLARTPGMAKRLGRRVKCRGDWENVKYSIMVECLKQKFLGNSLFADMLLSTGDEALAEDASLWNDCEWGLGKSGKGKNLLGKALMEVRCFLSQKKKYND